MPEILEARYRIVTPMFLGGHRPEVLADSIRAPSVKGALRFWWRALQWGRTRQGTGSDRDALVKLHGEEARIFGRAADETGGGQSSFLLRVTPEGPLRWLRKGQKHAEFAKCPGCRYLGYGLMVAFDSRPKNEKAGQLTRPCFAEGQEFHLQLRSRTAIDPTVREALIAWGLLGGLGGRARHGFGSVALEGLEVNGKTAWTAPGDADAYAASLRELLGGLALADEDPPFSAFGPNTRIDILGPRYPTAYEALRAFGEAQMHYRSWGHQGRVLGRESEQNFPEDHDWSKGKRPRGFHPRRVLFGLPHNYGDKKHMRIEPEHSGRRASPLFFHVHPLGGRFAGVSLLLRAAFLPDGERIDAGGTLVPPKVEWSVLTDLLDGTDPVTRKARFPGRQPLRWR